MNAARTGFVVKTFPKLSETFVLGEILGLERMGMQLEIFSVQRPTDQIQHQEINLVTSPVRYLSDYSDAAFLSRMLAHLQEAFGNPIRYAEALALAFKREPGRALSIFSRAVSLARAARDARLKHLHAHFANEPASIAECAAHLSDISYSISAHAKDIYTSGTTSLREKLNNASFVVTCTECNRNYLSELVDRHPHVYRMYHGIDVTRFSPARNRPVGTPLILSVGRLREKKGFATLIQSCALLKQKGIDFRCEIVGYGEDLERLEKLIADLGLKQQVELVGTMNHDLLIERYRQASMFVLPCQVTENGDRDGIPNVMLEAMAMELPVVTTHISGIPEVVVDGKNGLLIPPSDPASLASRIEALLCDEALSHRLGMEARQTIKAMFNNEQNLKLVHGLLQQTMENVNPKGKAESEKAYV